MRGRLRAKYGKGVDNQSVACVSQFQSLKFYPLTPFHFLECKKIVNTVFYVGAEVKEK
jgi:hypothetical protein